jgi:hypothetical protein
MTSVFFESKETPFVAPQRTISSMELDAIAAVSSTVSPTDRMAVSSA